MNEDALFEKCVDYLEDESNPYISFEQFKRDFYPNLMRSELICDSARKFQQSILGINACCYSAIYS